jgi:hypothetical protein
MRTNEVSARPPPSRSETLRLVAPKGSRHASATEAAVSAARTAHRWIRARWSMLWWMPPMNTGQQMTDPSTWEILTSIGTLVGGIGALGGAWAAWRAAVTSRDSQPLVAASRLKPRNRSLSPTARSAPARLSSSIRKKTSCSTGASGTQSCTTIRSDGASRPTSPARTS